MVEIESCALPLAQLGNSDAHLLNMIGTGSSWFEGTTAQDLKTALINRTTIPRRGTGLTGISVLTSYIPNYLLRKLGCVSWNPAPEASIRLANLAKIQSMNSMTQFVQP
jgi:hypothetical protein